MPPIVAQEAVEKQANQQGVHVPIKSTSNAAIPPDEYDNVAANLTGPISTAEGFLFHVAESAPDGIRVTEVWASREQAQQFYDTAVRPNLPPGVPEPTITELHNTIVPAGALPPLATRR